LVPTALILLVGVLDINYQRLSVIDIITLIIIALTAITLVTYICLTKKKGSEK